MNFSVVPDFLAIGGLIAVFQSLLRRIGQTRLRFWLAGWVLLLVHIAAQFVSQNVGTDPAGALAVTVSLSMLLLASLAFIWAGSGLYLSRPRNIWLTLATAVPDVLLIGCIVMSVADAWIYQLLTAAGCVTSLWMISGERRASVRALRGRRYAIVIVAYAIQSALLASSSGALAIVWMLFWHYVAVAAIYWRSAPRASVGVVFTTVSFVTWALVFPVGYAMAVWLPHVHVEAEVWNLPKFLVATGMIFTLLEEQLSRAEHASRHDSLTGLPNRRLFVDRLESALDAARETSRRLALLVIDLDDFKQVNDNLGHAAGDTLLQHAAERFRVHLREHDTLARLGGDEFAVILHDVADRAAAVNGVDKLLQALSVPGLVDGGPVRVRASIGVALFPDDATDPTALYAAADRAMYGRKRREGLLPVSPGEPA
jgi:diguanylate cyclase